MFTTLKVQIAILLVGLLAVCDAPAQSLPAAVQAAMSAADYTANPLRYGFADGTPAVQLERAFSPPAGFTRVEVAPSSFAAWLRGLPLRADRTDVRSYKGSPLNSPAAAIVAIDVGERNLQQCADSAIRLHAEFLWSQKRYDELAYHFTSGDEIRYSDWVKGERIRVTGNKVRHVAGSPRPRTHSTFRNWLDLVYSYAGTRSLHRDSESITPANIRAGDFFVSPGSPGHAVVILDIAEASSGRRVALIGQGYMPAQDFHVLRDSGGHVIDGVWFVLPRASDDLLDTPSWRPFRGADARRFLP